ncbi:hypothetical protein [Halogeometricum limi]|uniref:Dolichyl-phosphate-mannose-protein mannosyltransferase n=1 Tax=Halogeometricum limi TaxID=555875 RepID=A0A1I6IJX0_9EURY|nr:hypothetical protein [Halogeometricum limi]SFR67016.1 hypothetical protein SAMN04488124_3312 [Halogeometricum limi]
MQRDLTDLLVRAFFPLAIAGSATAVALVGVVLNPKIALKGSYALIGMVLASVIYYALRFDPEDESERTGESRHLAKVVYVLVFLSVAAINLWSVERALVLLSVLPLGYALLVVQLQRRTAGVRLLPQIVGLYAVSPLTLYLDTGFYFSRGDTIKHIDKIELIFAQGTTSALLTSDLYHFFPGLHLMTGTLKEIAGIGAYDAFMLAGISSYAMLVLLVYLVYSQLLNATRLACVTAFTLTMLGPILTYATYFFPQAFAVVLIMFTMFVGLRIRYTASRTPLVLLTVVLSSALAFTHHLTLVFFAFPVAFVLFVPPVARRLFPKRTELRELATPRTVPLVVGGVAGFSYWIQADVFLQALVASLHRIFGNQVVGDTNTETSSLFVRGVTVPDLTVEMAARSLVSPDGIYNTLLLAVFAVGVVTILGNRDRFKRPAMFVLVGLSSALLMFQTPLVALGYKRVRLPLSFFFVIVVAAGVYYLLNSDTRNVVGRAFVVLLVVSLAVSASLVTGDDLYGVHKGPDLGELQPTPEPQKEFSEHELRSMEVASQYARAYEVPVETDWVTAGGLGIDLEAGQMKVKAGQLRAEEGALLYRTRWPQHSVVVITEQRFELVMSESGYDELLEENSKVYTTGSLGILWSDDSILVAESLGQQPQNDTAAGA